MEDHSNLKKICLSALREAKKTVESLGEEGRKELPKQGEPLTKSDMAVSKTLKKHFLNSSLDAIFHSEEAGIINSPSDPRYIIYFDEIDGTFNYQRGGLLPSTTVISAFNHPETPLLF